MRENIPYTNEDLKDHIAVGAVIKDSQGRILMQKHNKYGFLTIPIGKATSKQSPEEALRQELAEECGIKIQEYKEIAERDYEYIRKGKKVKMRLYLYEIKSYSGVPINNEPEKHQFQEFKILDEIKESPYLSDATLLFLETKGYRRPAKM